MAFLFSSLSELSDAVKAAIEDKSVRATTEEVVIREKNSPTGKEAKRAYVALEALNGKGMAILCGGKTVPATAKAKEGDDERTPEQKAAGACDYFNYGYDLELRATVRAKLMTLLEGPEKAVIKMGKLMVANGFPAESAVDIILAQRKVNQEAEVDRAAVLKGILAVAA